MLVAVLEGTPRSIKRNVEFNCGVFSVDGLGEVSADDLRGFDAAGRLGWVSWDVRSLALGFSRGSGFVLGEALPQPGAETEVIYVPPHRIGSKTEAELKCIVDDMVERGWILVEDSRLGSSGGQLTFHRSEPLSAEVLSAVSPAG